MSNIFGKIYIKDLVYPNTFKEYLKNNIQTFKTRDPSNAESKILLEYIKEKIKSSKNIDISFWNETIDQLIKKFDTLEVSKNGKK